MSRVSNCSVVDVNEGRHSIGLLTRPIGDVVVLMLPLCVTLEEIDLAVAAIEWAVTDLER